MLDLLTIPLTLINFVFSVFLNLYLANYDVVVEQLTPWSLTQEALKRLEAGTQIKYHYFALESITFNRQRLLNV